MKRILFLVFCVGLITSSCNIVKGGDFKTSDLMLFELKGHVKTLKYNRTDPYVVTFDENGMVTSCPCYDQSSNFNFKNGKAVGKYFSSNRNAKGQLTKYAYEPVGNNYWRLDMYEITYNDNGQADTIVHTGWESQSEIKCKYDDKGLCIEEVEDYYMASIVGKETRTYTYIKFDDNDNWIERKCKKHNVEWEEDDNLNNKMARDEEYVETRTITYYQ
ncbi:hypothetical protein [Prevotella sp. OH937_COT-195]|uniref:hypothetical protein n=1 Tax=Prevotella sp. OH937_COT-195 TaxID=2491051 RepID=UPI000F64EB54|nr:hypothetical protein [Prevotella sp. OH937_COT-195]RRC98713.1 hypothetical protein EII32_08935 [Prevotella sp. OH937_COT-195]